MKVLLDWLGQLIGHQVANNLGCGAISYPITFVWELVGGLKIM
jgi:hypothetical protein